jgi:hypothetical protein
MRLNRRGFFGLVAAALLGPKIMPPRGAPIRFLRRWDTREGWRLVVDLQRSFNRRNSMLAETISLSSRILF